MLFVKQGPMVWNDIIYCFLFKWVNSSFFMTYINRQEIWFHTLPTLEFYCRKEKVVKIMHIPPEWNYFQKSIKMIPG